MELFKLFGTIAIQNADADKAIDDTTDKASQSEGKISAAFKKIGAAVATYFAIDKIKDFGLSCINAASDAQAAASQFSQVFGNLERDASQKLSSIADSTGIMEERMKGSYTQIAAFAKTSGMDTQAALSLADRAMIAVADSAAFYDRSLEDTTESLQSFLKGNYENDAALGLSCTETTRNAAANALYGKSFNDLSEAQKQLTLLQMVEDANAASGALGQAARESETWTNQTGNLQQAWINFQAAIGENFLEPAVSGVMKVSDALVWLTGQIPNVVMWIESFWLKCQEFGNYLTETFSPVFNALGTLFVTVAAYVQQAIAPLTSWVTSGDAATQTTGLLKTAIEGLATGLTTAITWVTQFVQWLQTGSTGAEAFKAVIIGITAAFVAYNAIMQAKAAAEVIATAASNGLKIAQAALNLVMNANPFMVVVTAVSALAAAVIYLWNTNEGFRTAVTTAWAAIQVAFSTAVAAVSGFLANLGTSITSVWGIFTGWVTTTAASIATWAVNAGASIVNWAATAATSIATWAAGAISSIATWASGAWDTVSTWVSDTVGSFVEWAGNVGTAVSDWAESVGTTVSDWAETALETVSTWVTDAGTSFSDWAESVGTTVSDWAETALETVSTWVTDAGTSFSDWAESVGTTVSDWSTTAGETVSTWAENAFTSISDWAGNVGTTVEGWASTAKTTFGNFKSDAGNKISTWATNAKTAFSSWKTNVTTTVGGWKDNITTTVREGLSSAYITVSTRLGWIKKKFTNIFESAKTIVSNAIENIKGFFDFDWSLPKLKLPHVNISGSFSLAPPSVPTFSIAWYKKAMDEPYMFTKPTLFDVNPATGTAKGAGEAGDEVMIGKETMLGMIRQAVAMGNSCLLEKFDLLIALLDEFFPKILDAQLGMNIVLEDGTLVGKLAPKMDEALGDLMRKKERGGRS